jgi:hypothetical protein
MSLGEAVEAIKKIHAAEGRSKAPRLSIVKPLGYSSINGRSLSVLGALKAYGLLDGRSDEMRISQEGFTLANAPVDSAEYREALKTSFRAPAAFQQFTAEDDAASPDTLKWKLQKAGFQPESAERLVRVYRESRDLVNAAVDAYKPSRDQGQTDQDQSSNARFAVGDLVRWVSQGVVQFEDRRLLGFSDNGEWAFVERSQTGIPVAELELIERPSPSGTPPSAPAELLRPTRPSLANDGEPDFVVKLGDGRVAVIQIKGGEAEARHLSKLARFIKLQEQLLGEDVEG